jgi:hypothetical protein
VIFGASGVSEAYGKQIARDKRKVSFVIDHTVPVHAPYGLMFGGPDSLSAASVCSKTYKDEGCRKQFWREKHGVSVVYSTTCQTPRPEEYEGLLHAQHARTQVFGIFNRNALNHALDSQRLKWPREIMANSAAEFKIGWPKAASDHHNILYFFCHANGEKLMISHSGSLLDDVLVPIALAGAIKDYAEKRRQPVGGLIVLNGCQTAVFSGEGGWLKATRASGFEGFIGTESLVPTRFAWPFGNDLLNLVVSKGNSPLEAMQKLWKMHWPLSILYNLYCIADTRISEPLKLEYLNPVGRKNYSRLQLGRGQHATLPFGEEDDSAEELSLARAAI